ncbi:hypothetical protein ABZ419_24680 [Streptomyces cinnamoneus]|uniref:hypothetical protein n=1 Tax=Streptomyces cinnamoneus TaxID=53446 RepID=UPI003400D2BC
MSAMSPRRRTAFRAAVASAALASAVLAPTAAFAAEPAPAAPAAPAAKATEPAAGTATPAAQAEKRSDSPKVEKAGKAETKAPEKAAQGDKHGKGSQADQGSAAGKGSEAGKGGKDSKAGKGAGAGSGKAAAPVLVTLVDGHEMAIGKDRPDNFRAELVVDGHVALILSSQPGLDVGYWGGMRVVLHKDGTVASSWDKGPVTPADRPGDPHAGDADRYSGTAVSLGNGMIAVLRHDPNTGGPEAWIRYVGWTWQQGDAATGRVATVLNREHRTETVRGLHLSLEGADGSRPVLRVDGKTFAFPAGGTATKAAAGTAVKATQAKAVTAAQPAQAAAAVQTKVMPQGGVAAGAEGVGQGDNDTLLLASGGALASAGAAGLGFAVLYRRRTAAGLGS